MDLPSIYRNSAWYDQINAFDFDIAFYQRFAESLKGKVLELGCGTGRILVPLAKAGIDVVGVDLSEEMLSKAEKKASEQSVSAQWHIADIRDFDLNHTFKLIICAHNTFSHLEKDEDVEGFFKSVKKHLEKDGRLIIQVFNPDLEVLKSDPEEEMPLISIKDPETNVPVEIFESSYYDEVDQVNHQRFIYKSPGKEDRVEMFSVRVFYPRELDMLARYHGFEIVDKFGDFDETPFNEYPDTQILILKRKD